LTGLSPPFFTALSGTHNFKIILPIPIPGDSDSVLSSLNLEEAIYFIADQLNCNASKVMLCEDANCATQLISTDIYLDINPTVKDFDGVTRAVLNINRAALGLIREIYIVGYTSHDLHYTSLKGVIAVCGTAITIIGGDLQN
jgi:hypothetical protein